MKMGEHIQKIMEHIQKIHNTDIRRRKMYHAEMLVSCALLDKSEPFENNLMLDYKSKRNGYITVTVQRGGKNSPTLQAKNMSEKIKLQKQTMATMHEEIKGLRTENERLRRVCGKGGETITSAAVTLGECQAEWMADLD
jgi:hypothetical protein